jgi:2-hydroxychromene-2-carboxylate isomerase
VDWYFDFISPYAWLQAENLHRLPGDIVLTCKPVLFAGLLEHWGQLGPAEIVPKRRFTYRYTVWRARSLGLPVRLPPSHPFNPLKLLRLAVALDAQREVVQKLFRFVWSEGKLAEDHLAWSALIDELGVPDADTRIADPAVKDRLKRNTEEAVARGVFGVPTMLVDDELFWGADATDMLLDYLAADPVFGSEEMLRASALPAGVARRRK